MKRKKPKCQMVAAWLPTAAELRERIAAVQSRWSDAERERRIVGPRPAPYELPEIVMSYGVQDDAPGAL